MRKKTQISSAVLVTVPATETYGAYKRYKGNNTVKVIQACPAKRAGISALGTKYTKGTPIIHFGSHRCTGEVYVVTIKEIRRLTYEPRSRACSQI
jgi:hypothetical protein